MLLGSQMMHRWFSFQAGKKQQLQRHSQQGIHPKTIFWFSHLAMFVQLRTPILLASQGVRRTSFLNRIQPVHSLIAFECAAVFTSICDGIFQWYLDGIRVRWGIDVQIYYFQSFCFLFVRNEIAERIISSMRCASNISRLKFNEITC